MLVAPSTSGISLVGYEVVYYSHDTCELLYIRLFLRSADQLLHPLHVQPHKGALLPIFVESVVPIGHPRPGAFSIGPWNDPLALVAG